jgi:hypothetical protein
MPLTAGVTVTNDADGQCARGWLVGVITATIKAISHIERSRGSENTSCVPTAGLVGNVVTACSERWLPAT